MSAKRPGARKASKKKVGVYPGTFDPVTNGHVSLVERATHLFDSVVVAVANNIEKRSLFSIDERLDLAHRAFKKFPTVRVDAIDGLTADYALEHGATAIIRGIRAVSDFEFEFQMALMNRKLAHEVETVFMMPALSWVYLSSTLVKDVAKNGGDVSTLVPTPVNTALKKKFAKR